MKPLGTQSSGDSRRLGGLGLGANSEVQSTATSRSEWSLGNRKGERYLIAAASHLSQQVEPRLLGTFPCSWDIVGHPGGIRADTLA